jgi:hypothetical protein
MAVIAMLVAMVMVAAACRAAEFVVFDATAFTGKPDLRTLGMKKLPVVYSAREWWPGDPMGLPPRREFENRLGELINRLPWDEEVLICIDIESWPTQDDVKRAKSVANLREVLRWARSRAGSSRYRFGYYSMIPVHSYYDALLPDDAPKKIALQRANGELEPLAREVDAIFPSLYTFSTDKEEWRVSAIATLREARRYGKPVYAFIWPQYHGSAGFWRAHEPIEIELWRLQLQTVRDHADGVVIWGGYDFEHERPARWDEQAGWWQATKQFLAEISAAQGSR